MLNESNISNKDNFNLVCKNLEQIRKDLRGCKTVEEFQSIIERYNNIDTKSQAITDYLQAHKTNKRLDALESKIAVLMLGLNTQFGIKQPEYELETPNNHSIEDKSTHSSHSASDHEPKELKKNRSTKDKIIDWEHKLESIGHLIADGHKKNKNKHSESDVSKSTEDHTSSKTESKKDLPVELSLEPIQEPIVEVTDGNHAGSSEDAVVETIIENHSEPVAEIKAETINETHDEPAAELKDEVILEIHKEPAVELQGEATHEIHEVPVTELKAEVILETHEKPAAELQAEAILETHEKPAAELQAEVILETHEKPAAPELKAEVILETYEKPAAELKTEVILETHEKPAAELKTEVILETHEKPAAELKTEAILETHEKPALKPDTVASNETNDDEITEPLQEDSNEISQEDSQADTQRLKDQSDAEVRTIREQQLRKYSQLLVKLAEKRDEFHKRYPQDSCDDATKAYGAAYKLVDILNGYAESYKNQGINLDQFKAHSSRIINMGRHGVLGEHRGCKEILTNLLLAIGTLGIGYALAALFTQSLTPLKINTATADLLEDAEQQLDSVKVQMN